jgi:hypothetical protein
MALHPVGPLPASTYWRRRLVLVLVVVLPLLLARSCLGGGSTPRPGPSSSPTPTHSPLPSPTASRTASHPPAALTTCRDSALTLSTRTDTSDYKVGSTVRVTLTITNTSRVGCRRDLGPGAMEVLVYSGPERIWSSDDCAADTTSSVQTLRAGGSLQTTVSWSGKRSARGCPTPRTTADPGTYVARARIGTLQASRSVFRLHR